MREWGERAVSLPVPTIPFRLLSNPSRYVQCACVRVCMRTCVYAYICACVCIMSSSYVSAFVSAFMSTCCVLQTKYSKRIYKLFHECFKWFPIATVVNEETVVLHGGISMQPGVTMEDLNAIPRHECKMNE